MRRALISDIHGNLEALETVLADIDDQKVDEIYCLGDIVGYCTNPCECLDLVMQRCELSILGNHDHAALFGPEDFSPPAARAILWARAQLENVSVDAEASLRRREYLGELPESHSEGDLLFVHGSPRHPLLEYVFPEEIFNDYKMKQLFALVPKYCFQGHTHVPGVFDEGMRFHLPDEIDYVYPLGDRKLMINVGSVGQPRDGDPRACYVILEDEAIRFRRLEYDIEKTAKKIYAVPELDNFLADRLREGR